MKNQMLIVIPNSKWYNKRPSIIYPPPVCILTAILKDSFPIDILDANGLDLTEKTCKDKIKKYAPDLLLVSAGAAEYHQQFHAVMAMAKSINTSIVTVMGGVYPTVMCEEALVDKNVDYIFIGHAEERAVDFFKLIIAGNKEKLMQFPGIGMRTNGDKMKINPLSTFIADVKNQVKPDYALTDLTPYLIRKSTNYQLNSKLPSVPIMTSYGCPMNCVFCATRTINGRKVAFRPIEDVLEEIDYLRFKYNIQEFIIMDDNFLLKKERIIQFLTQLNQRKYELKFKIITVAAWHLNDEILELLKESGCYQLTISVESGCQRVLKEIVRKPLKLEIVPLIVNKCKSLGIDIAANFVIGFPGEKWNELLETFNYAEKCNFDLVHFHIATPLPKTDLYYIAKSKGLLPKDFSFLSEKYFGFSQAFIHSNEFTIEKLMELRATEWERINFKTIEKTVKIAQMYNTSIDELNKHRQMTLQKQGLHFPKTEGVQK